MALAPRLAFTTALVSLAAVSVSAQTGPVLPVPPEIEGAAVLAVLPPDAIRAIDAPTFVRGSAAEQQMTEDELIIGVRLGGEARAYPLGYLTAHEIVNDRFGPTPVAVTW